MSPDLSLDSVPGWFRPIDRKVFRFMLSAQHDWAVRGDLAELGVYQGQSAILIGEYLREGETFTVVDLFEDAAGDQANEAENRQTYEGLTQRIFEAHYLRFHPTLPSIVRGYSASVTDHARLGHHRFVHIDASHLYVHVRADIAASRKLLTGDGVLALDDIRTVHAPGVAAAAWEAVLNNCLHPVLITDNKLYATWGDPHRWLSALRSWLPDSGLAWEEQEVAGRALLRGWGVADAAESVSPGRATFRRLRRLVAGTSSG